VTNAEKKHNCYHLRMFPIKSQHDIIHKSGILHSKVQYHLVTNEIFVLQFASLGGSRLTFRDTVVVLELRVPITQFCGAKSTKNEYCTAAKA
jgi:hypothetical protein